MRRSRRAGGIVASPGGGRLDTSWHHPDAQIRAGTAREIGEARIAAGEPGESRVEDIDDEQRATDDGMPEAVTHDRPVVTLWVMPVDERADLYQDSDGEHDLGGGD